MWKKSACAVCTVCSNFPADCEGHLTALKLPEAVFYGSDVPFLVDLLRCIDPSSGHLIMDDSEVDNVKMGRAPSYKALNVMDMDGDMDVDEVDGHSQTHTQTLELERLDQVVRRSRTRSLVHTLAGYSCKREGAAPAYKVCKVTRDNPFPISRKLPDDDDFGPMDAAAVVRVLDSLRPCARATLGMTADDLAAVRAQLPSSVQVVPQTVVRPPIASADQSQLIRDPVTVALEHLQRAVERASRDQLTPALRRIIQDAVNRYNSALEARMPGKDGRWQDTLISKRSDQSGRGVIVGDPNMAPDEVGVPYRMAKQLSVDVRVFSRNLEDARGRVAACNHAMSAGLLDSAAAAAVHGVTWGNGKKYAPRKPSHQVRAQPLLISLSPCMTRPMPLNFRCPYFIESTNSFTPRHPWAGA